MQRLRYQIALFTLIRLIFNTAHRMVYPFLGVIARGLGVDLPAMSVALTARAVKIKRKDRQDPSASCCLFLDGLFCQLEPPACQEVGCQPGKQVQRDEEQDDIPPPAVEDR